MNYPRPINCECGREISWAASIENLSMNTPYYAVRCVCGKTSGVARTERQAAIKWNIMRKETKNEAIEARSRNQFDPNLKHAIIGKMANENASDLSDAEIDRILGPCVAPWLPQVAKMYRDCEIITETMLEQAKKEVTT